MPVDTFIPSRDNPAVYYPVNVKIDGPAAIDVLLSILGPRLAERWDGDEAFVGMIVEDTGRVGVAWIPRERILADLSRRGEAEQDPRRKERFTSATSVLRGPRAEGKVDVVVVGWGDLRTIALDVEDLRLGKKLTTWKGGSA